MDLFTLILITVLVLLISIWWLKGKSGQNPLPGPMGLPIVGYLPFLTENPHIKLQDLRKIYGPVYRIKMGSQNVVVLCDFQSIKEAFAFDAFMGRPADIPMDFSEDTIRTGAFLDMPWKEQRRFCLHMFRDLGFGKTKTESHIKEEILEMLQRVEDLKGAPVKTSDILAPSTSNNIASFLFGSRLTHNDPRRIRLDKALTDIVLLSGNLGWQMFFPWIRAVVNFLQIGPRVKLRKAIDEVKKYCREEMEMHEATFDPNHIRDFMDGYLLEIQKRSDDPDSTFKKDVLFDLARAFFAAGSETVRVTVDWLLLVCAAYPEVQKKIHSEIDEIIGPERFPARADHLMMPYTEAAILEVMRWRTSLPLNVLRYTLKDTMLNGYFVPKHCHVIAVLYAVDRDKNLWGNDVATYKPERFLSEDGKKVVKPEYFIPFSTGKRACPGKSLAEVEVFLYVTSMLQKFAVSMPPGKKADLEPVLGLSLQPKRQNLCLKQRV